MRLGTSRKSSCPISSQRQKRVCNWLWYERNTAMIIRRMWCAVMFFLRSIGSWIRNGKFLVRTKIRAAVVWRRMLGAIDLGLVSRAGAVAIGADAITIVEDMKDRAVTGNRGCRISLTATWGHIVKLPSRSLPAVSARAIEAGNTGGLRGPNRPISPAP